MARPLALYTHKPTIRVQEASASTAQAHKHTQARRTRTHTTSLKSKEMACPARTITFLACACDHGNDHGVLSGVQVHPAILPRHPRRPTPTISVRAQCMRHWLHKTKHGYEFGNALALAFVLGASHVKELGFVESIWRRTPSSPRICYFSDKSMPLTITIKGKTLYNLN